MHPVIKFNSLSDPDFVSLKKEFVFNVLKGTTTAATFGENIYSGNTPTNKECFLFEYHDNQKPAVSFIILSGGTSVFYHATNSTSPQTVRSLIRGNITKFCLQEQGHFCLHASAICVHNKVVLFIGRKGAGKSTLATCFHLNGHSIWCDDYSVLQKKGNTFFAFQGETSLKINPDIASSLNIPKANLKSVFELPVEWKRSAQSDLITQKYYFNQHVHQQEHSPRQVEAVFFLNQRVPNPTRLVSNIQKSDAHSILMEEILLAGLNSKKYLRNYFESTVGLLKTVPSFTINSPDNIMRINEVYNSVIETLNIPQHEPGN